MTHVEHESELASLYKKRTTMARLYPTNIPEDIPASESHLLELIKSDLDDEYLAIWSSKTVSRDEKGSADVLDISARI